VVVDIPVYDNTVMNF